MFELRDKCNSSQMLEVGFGAFTFVAGRSLISSLRLPMEVLQSMTASSLLFTWRQGQKQFACLFGTFLRSHYLKTNKKDLRSYFAADLITSGNICLQEILRWCLWTYLFLGLLQKSDGFLRICSTKQVYINRFMANVHILNTRCCFIPCIWRAT